MPINYRHNIMTVDSVATFARVRGGYNKGNRDVYFLRMIGGNDTLKQDIYEIDQLLSAKMEQRQLFYKRLSSLPMDLQEADRAYYLSCYEQWVASNYNSMHIRFENENEIFAQTLGIALKTVELEYDKQKSSNTASIKRNFIIKLIRWTDYVLQNQVFRWDERSCIKIIANNVVKMQEYLFYYMLTLLGADVMLIQNQQDLTFSGEMETYSKKVVLGDFVTWDIPLYFTSMQDMPHNVESTKGILRNNQDTIHVNIPKHIRREKHADCNRKKEFALPKASLRDSRTSQHKENTFEELALLASSIVMITMHDENGEPVGSGSGIMIGENGYILTNYHVVSGGIFYSVQIENDDIVYETDEIIKYHSLLDLAIIRIRRKLNPLPIYKGTEPLVRGQKVVAIGSPLGLFNSVSDGIISGFRTVNSVNMIQFTAPISPGSSGGAVLNLFGEVIGISTARIDYGQNINLAVLYEDINMFVKGFY